MVTASASTETLNVLTSHSGIIHLEPAEVLHFSPPLAPFLNSRRYALVAAATEAPFLWLQSLDEPALALVVAPYETACAEPSPALPAHVRQALGLRSDEAPETYVVVCVSADPAATTVNLLASLFVCRRTGRARQVILEGDLSLARWPLLAPDASPGRETDAGADATGG